MKRQGTIAILIILALGLSLLLSACKTADPPIAESPTGDQGNQPSAPAADSGNEPSAPAAEPQPAGNARTDLVFGLMSYPTSFNPSVAADQNMMIVNLQLYDQLFWWDEASNSPEARLCTEWSWSDDHLALEISIREGVVFHNGDAFTMEDVQFSLDLYKASSAINGYVLGYDYTEIIDDHHGIIHFSKPFAGALSQFSASFVSMLPKGYYNEVGADEFAVAPIGTGAYKFVSAASGDNVVFEANENYWRGSPAIKRLTFRAIVDSNAQMTALETGEIDLMSHMDLAHKNYVVGRDGLTWHGSWFKGLLWLDFHLTDPILSNENVRRAIAHAVDREELILGAVDGNGEANYSMTVPGLNGYSRESAQRVSAAEYDLEKAKEYMALAGYPDGFAIEMITQENEATRRPTEILQSQLAKIGIDISITVMERTAYISRYMGGDFRIFVHGPWMVVQQDAGFLYNSYTSNGPTNAISGYLQDSALDAYFDAQFVEFDEQARNDIWVQLCQYMNDNAYGVPLYLRENATASNSALKGIAPDNLYRNVVFNMSW